MVFILGAIGTLMVSGLCAFIINRFAKTACFIGAGGVIIASLVGLIPVIRQFINGTAISFSLPWPVPYGSFLISIDSLSALFLFPVFILAAVSALYGSEYLSAFIGKKSIGAVWFFFNILIASMVIVVIARNAILFLTAWEVMSVSSFFLVTLEDNKENARKAGLIYLIAAHIGTAFLLAMFILLSSGSGSFDFSQFNAGAGIVPSVIFVLAVIGFGTKAGFIPFHIWLPEAHPAAPSFVSAIMSGVMIKTGIYGLLRVLIFLGKPVLWWGWLLIIIGVVSGLLGILFALAQKDIKRLLAYSSIENIGIITLGIGMGIIGLNMNLPVLAVLGFTGSLLHVVNHAFFKGLLFLGAGSVLHSTGTGEIDDLGGMFKKMPWTGVCFLIGALAVSGLPVLNGFISEFLIYLAAFKNLSGVTSVTLAGLITITSLALIGGLAAACFTKAFGMIFLGQPRSAHAHAAHESGLLMRIAMVMLSAGCFIIGLTAPFILDIFKRIIIETTGMQAGIVEANIADAVVPLIYIVIVSICLVFGVVFFIILRQRLLMRRQVGETVTWDCGYAQSTNRMQYTASSFTQPLTDFFHAILMPRKYYPKISGYFPGKAGFSTETPDIFHQSLYRFLFKRINRAVVKVRWIQHGRLQFYILYILVSLLALLIWKFW